MGLSQLRSSQNVQLKNLLHFPLLFLWVPYLKRERQNNITHACGNFTRKATHVFCCDTGKTVNDHSVRCLLSTYQRDASTTPLLCNYSKPPNSPLITTHQQGCIVCMREQTEHRKDKLHHNGNTVRRQFRCLKTNQENISAIM